MAVFSKNLNIFTNVNVPEAIIEHIAEDLWWKHSDATFNGWERQTAEWQAHWRSLARTAYCSMAALLFTVQTSLEPEPSYTPPYGYQLEPKPDG